ncbi:MAG: hypothetical protein ACLUTU_09305 [Blautia faecis]
MTTTATQPPAAIAAISAFVPAIIALTAASSRFDRRLYSSNRSPRRDSGCLCSSLSRFYGSLCRRLRRFGGMLGSFIAAFEVACAVFTDFCVVFTVPFGGCFYCLFPLRAVCVMVFSA